jgi:hypothetical protein
MSPHLTLPSLHLPKPLGRPKPIATPRLLNHMGALVRRGYNAPSTREVLDSYERETGTSSNNPDHSCLPQPDTSMSFSAPPHSSIEMVDINQGRARTQSNPTCLPSVVDSVPLDGLGNPDSDRIGRDATPSMDPLNVGLVVQTYCTPQRFKSVSSST